VRVLVTRPEREARSWVLGLRAAGLEAVPLPLIDIAAVVDPLEIQRAWQRISLYQAVMFVSGNAVEQFFALKPAGGLEIRAWATGPGTARALEQAGVRAALIDTPQPDAPQFDSEALWALVVDQVSADSRVLIVRGSDAGSGPGVGRDWLAQQVVASGGEVDFVVAYRRLAPTWTPEQVCLARTAAADGSVWLFSSSESIANLVQNTPGLDWAAARAVVTHPRIAQSARELGFGVVCQSRPALADVIASIESLG
jgi:uroporphyrinogen-III synthase